MIIKQFQYPVSMTKDPVITQGAVRLLEKQVHIPISWMHIGLTVGFAICPNKATGITLRALQPCHIQSAWACNVQYKDSVKRNILERCPSG